MATITYRYQWVGFDPEYVAHQIDPGSTALSQPTTTQIFIDVNYDDTFPKADLDRSLSKMGWSFVSTPNPVKPLPSIVQGAGSPEGVVTAEPGSIYQNSDGGLVIPALWVKNTGSGNTGWVGVSTL